jgi:CelD/BcsL family acetyltransferase involved in cellulose biosynthesis
VSNLPLNNLEVSIETFDSVAQDWERLLVESSDLSPFATPAWQQTWWTMFGGDADLKLLTVRQDGAVKGLAPFMRRGNELSFLGESDLVDYHHFLHSGIDETTFYETVIGHISGVQSLNSLRLTSVPEWSVAYKAVPEAARAAGWQVEETFEDVSPGIELADNWEDYVSGLGKKDRHELRRKLRRLERSAEIKHVEYSTAEDITANLDDFVRLHRMSTPDKAEFMTDYREEFFRAAVTNMARVGASRLYFLEIDGKRAATSICFVHGDSQLAYNSGYDPEQRALSVGLLNHAMTIKLAIENGIRYFDFLRGDESYKYHLGAHDRSLYNLVVTRG